MVTDLDYCNLRERGLMIVTFTQDKAMADWQFIDTVKQESYQISSDLNKTLSLNVDSKTLV
jgi:alkaline phosphatase D